MSKPDNRFLFLFLTIMIAVVFYSCSDGPTDPTADITETDLFLQVERLPTAPSGMVYELWVANKVLSDRNVTAGEVVSIGRFDYIDNDTIKAFLDPGTGLTRADSNHFVLKDDLNKFRSIIVSVEEIAVINNVPGPIVLIDNIVDLVANPDIVINMNFPLSSVLWDAAAWYNLEAVSDEDRNAGDGTGIWFASYRLDTAFFQDTTRFDFSWNLDTIIPEFPLDTTIDTTIIDTLIPSAPDTIIDTNFITMIDTINIILPDSIQYAFINDTGGTDTAWLVEDLLNLDSIYQERLYDLLLIKPDSSFIDTFVITYKDSILLGLDSIVHIGIAARDSIWVDSSYPFTKRTFVLDPSDVDTGPLVTIILDVFTQAEFGLPVYTDWGWSYESWVTTNNSDPGLTSPLTFTPPSWRFKTPGNNWIPGYDGTLLSMGTFSEIDRPDDANPFTNQIFVGTITVIDTNKITNIIDTIIDTVYKNPPYPGEDFINSSATYGIDNINLTSDSGTVFITLEPSNRISNLTNFPLIVFVGELQLGDPGDATFLMKNISESVSGQITIAMPEITVNYNRK